MKIVSLASFVLIYLRPFFTVSQLPRDDLRVPHSWRSCQWLGLVIGFVLYQ